jgi:hypothetical protein
MDPRNLPPDPTTPMPAVTPGAKHGNGGTARPRLGSVYTICLTVLILVALGALGSGDLPDAARVLALVVGAGSAGILLGHTVRVEVNGREVAGHGQAVKRVSAQEFPHKDDQRRQE